MVERDSGPGGIYSRLADVGHGPVRFAEEVATRMPTSKRPVAPRDLRADFEDRPSHENRTAQLLFRARRSLKSALDARA
jgi:hypothetical protein